MLRLPPTPSLCLWIRLLPLTLGILSSGTAGQLVTSGPPLPAELAARTFSSSDYCGYLTGDPSQPRGPAPGFKCTQDPAHSLWGFCNTVFTEVSQCRLVGVCYDYAECTSGCVYNSDTALRTLTCTTQGTAARYCSTAILTVSENADYAYIACNEAYQIDHYQLKPTTVSATATPQTTSPTSTATTTATPAAQPTTSSAPAMTSQITAAMATVLSSTWKTSTTTSSSSSSSSSTSSTSPAPTAQSSAHSTNAGAIAGGTVGGVAGAVGLLGILVFLLRRRSHHSGLSVAELDAAPKPVELWGANHKLGVEGAVELPSPSPSPVGLGRETA